MSDAKEYAGQLRLNSDYDLSAAEFIEKQANALEQAQQQLIQINGQVAIADDGNWKDVIEKIGQIADGRTSPST